MLRKFKIRTRLLISFFIMAFFTFIIGLTAFTSLTSFRNLAVKTIHDVSILNDIYDNHIAIDGFLFSMIYIGDVTITGDIVKEIRRISEALRADLQEYLEIQDHFIHVFTPGEMQDMANLLEIYEEAYVPVLNEILDLVEHERREEATAVYVSLFTPIFDSFVYYVNIGFSKNMEYSIAEITKSSESATLNSYLMLALVLLSLLVSIILAFAVTKSISDPLSSLGEAAEKVAIGNLDVQFEHSYSKDEIARLSLRLSETLQRLNQVQRLQLDALEARHEKEKAEASMRSKGDFLAKMSHEIRTPMNAITGMAELALREDMPDAPREHILTIKQAGANLLSIINDILDFSKIESGKLEIVPAEYLFSSLINDVVSIIRTRVIDSNILFTVNIDSNIPNALFGDEIRIRQVFLNILSNAVKYTEKGFVSLTVNGETVGDTVNLTIEVADSGKGIKQENLKNLFGDFVQFDMKSNKGIEGTGLGLAITRNILKAMDGDIVVETEYGKGSTFTVTLPQKVCGLERLAFVETPHDKSVLLYEQREMYANSILRTLSNLGVDCTLASTDLEFEAMMQNWPYPFVFVSFDLFEGASKILSKLESDTRVVVLAKFGEMLADKNLGIITMPVHSISVANILNDVASESVFSANMEVVARFTAPHAKVLVVDDIQTNLKVAEGLLLPYKMQVKLCNSGPKAIEAVKNGYYDLIFMDHMMPDMDGVETTGHIREWEKANRGRPQIPIIALTANAVSGMKEMFIEKGFSDFLAKPIDISKLDELLVRWIPKEQRRHQNDIKPTEAKTMANASAPDIPGVDIQYGITMTGGTLNGYREVLSLFSRDVEERLPLLQSTPGADDMPLFITYVHALKSASASIGAAEVSDRAARLETAGKAGDTVFITENLFGFTECLTELVNGIKAWGNTGKNQSKSSPANEKPNAAIVLLLCELTVALEAQRADDVDMILERLMHQPLDPKTKEVLDQVSDDVLMTEYENAAKVIRKLVVPQRE